MSRTQSSYTLGFGDDKSYSHIAHPYVVVHQLCCTTDTQFANRMAHCEDAEHTVAGAAACIGDWCPDVGLGLFTGNLDGVVRMYYSAKPFNPKSELTGFIGNDQNYISDHNGVNVQVDASRPDRPNAQFNIITHNLEGLCYRDDPQKMARFEYVKDNLVDYFGHYITKGTVMLVQELALQVHKKDMDKQKAVLKKNMSVLLRELRLINPHLVGEDDGYTGCIIYDRSVWEPEDKISVNRVGSNKFSNAYLMKYLPYPDLKMWMVNIHLKAYGSAIKSRSSVNQAHINELANIIDHVVAANKEMYPIYFCGDFNNGTVKAELIMEASKLLTHHAKYGFRQIFYTDPLVTPQEIDQNEWAEALGQDFD